MKTQKFGPLEPATDADLPELPILSSGRTLVECHDGVRWRLIGTQTCRVVGGGEKRATLGLFVRPCATPGCRRSVKARVSLGALPQSVRAGALEVVRCDKCRDAARVRGPLSAAERARAYRARKRATIDRQGGKS